MEKEKWKPVAGYEGLYEVSDQGKVKSLARVAKKSIKRSSAEYIESLL